MAFANSNPFINPPRLSPPRPSLHTRTISRSPARQHVRDYDPLLRDLSPTSTLRAFVTPPDELGSSNTLAASIQTSSASERALGAKAAQACLDLRAWTIEMDSWQWPGTFDLPEPARKKLRMTVLSSGGQIVKEEDAEEYWGSIPAKVVQGYEKRADEIGQCLDEIDVEELKDFVLNSHYRVDSRPSSRDKRVSLGSNASITMKHLDDYTALVTATILQALPFLTKLSRLLDVWNIRLIVLRSGPRYVQDLYKVQAELDNSWTTICTSPSSMDFDRKSMLQVKDLVEHQIGGLGKRLDRFLDDLEGRDDTVPDSWIDEFEHLEAAYGLWVVQAERKVLENEWRSRKSLVNDERLTASTQGAEILSEIEDPAQDEDAVTWPSLDKDLVETSRPSPWTTAPQLALSIPSVLEGDGDTNMSATDSAKSSAQTETSSPLFHSDAPAQVAKRRAAFLHDIEVNNSLKQSKSPVRPFEHASSAFTRLFRKHESPEQARRKRTFSNKVNPSASVKDESSSETRLPISASTVSSPWSTSSQQDLNRSLNGLSEVHQTPGQTLDEYEPQQSESQQTVSEPVKPSTYYQPTSSAGWTESDVAERRPPETYKPTGLDSPFSSPDKEEFPESRFSVEEGFSENWPLKQAPHRNPEEVVIYNRQHEQAHGEYTGDSDPGPEIYKPSSPIPTDAFGQIFVQSLPQLAADDRRLSRDSDAMSLGMADKLQRRKASSRGGDATYLDMVSDASQRKSRRTSLQSLPQRPQPLAKDDVDTDILSMSDQVDLHKGLGQESMVTEPPRRSSSPILNNKVDQNVDLDDDVHIARPYLIKRASTTSIEIFSRSEVKSVDVQRPSRNGSASSRATTPQPPRLSLDHDPVKVAAGYHPTSIRRTSSSGQATPVAGRHVRSTSRGMDESSPITREASGSPMGVTTLAPLNSTIVKRRAKGSIAKENDRPGSRNSHQAPYVDTRDTFDRHVSEVLETLPSQIRFKPRPGAETPVPRAGDTRGYNAPRPKMPNTRVPSRTGNMTIVPAESSPKKSSSASDPEVKLYHLTQAGRDEPIKLFVRLVGEGERVMVRVGGGWADLADYLRQYADHHGSRTVSEGGLEVQALTAPLSRKVSGSAETRARTPGPGTPNAGTPRRPDSKDSDKDWYGRTSTPNGERPYTINGGQTPTSTHMSTPQSTSTGSRPSTANISRPSSRQGGTADGGLAGLSGSNKKANFSDHKAKWVEGMLERAKKASAEKSKEDNQKYFSELGKAGGTRRVIFRSSPGIGTGEKSK